MKSLDGKVAVVTGASRGAGRGIALELGEAGATVYITGRSVKGDVTRKELPETTIEDTAEEITKNGGNAIPVRVNHSNDEEVEALFERIKNEQGKLDILVNNVWSGYENMESFGAEFWNQPLWRWDTMSNSIRSHFTASRYAAPLMVPHEKGIMIGTTFWDEDRFFTSVPYYMAKMSVKLMAYSMAENLKRYNIASIALSLGWIRTEVLKKECNIDDYNYKDHDKFARTESTRYAGKAVVALASDPNIMEKSGGIFTTGGLAQEYDFYDIDGSRPAPYKRGQH